MAPMTDWNNDWGEVRISHEHGWLCIRQPHGWLLWSAKLSEMPEEGLPLDDVLAAALEAKRKDDKEMDDYARQP